MTRIGVILVVVLAGAAFSACGKGRLNSSDTCHKWLSADRSTKAAYVTQHGFAMSYVQLIDGYCERDSRNPQHLPLKRIVQLRPGNP
jgi:hypothetical protein